MEPYTSTTADNSVPECPVLLQLCSGEEEYKKYNRNTVGLFLHAIPMVKFKRAA